MLKKISLFLSIILLLNACGSAKKAEKSIANGDYDSAFNIAFTALSKDKNKKANQKLIPSLKEAFNKANDRDLHQIKMLKKENDPDNLKKIYATYVAMDIRQDDVLSLQPLYYNGKEVSFKTKDYSNEIETSLKEYSDYLYNKGNRELAGSKLDARKAFKTFNDLQFVNPNYASNLSDLINQAKEKGSSLVYLKFLNNTKEPIATEQQDELMRISESNMSNQWVIYDQDKQLNKNYDYEVTIELNKFNVSPEQINTQVVPQEARIKDGWEYVYDANGNVAKDSLGNDIKRDKIITVRAEVKLFQQLKESRIEGNVAIKDLKNNSLVNNTPIAGEAKFENVFAQYRGDQRAIEQKYVQALQNKEAPFPSNEEFIKYSLADFRAKMLQLLDQQNF